MSSWRTDAIKGKQSEDNTRRVLKELYNERYILSYRQTLRGSQDDRSGIDFYFSIKVKGRRIEIPLQVKSSKGGIKAHDKYYSMIHAVNGQSKDLREQIESIIIEYHNDLGGQDTVKPEVVSKPVEVVEPIEEERKLELVPAVSQNAINPEDIILEVRDGKVWTTSLEIARIYEKEHRSVLRSIDELEQSEEFILHNFVQHAYIDGRGNSQRMFYISKDGAYALCFKFQGKLAAQFREAFIKKFNEMEEELRNPKPLALSGELADVLQLAADRLRSKDLVITTLEQEKEVLAGEVVKQIEVNTKLATDNMTLSALTSADEKTYSLMEGGKHMFRGKPGPRIVIQAMREIGWIYKRGGDSPNLAKSNLEAKGYFKMVFPKVGDISYEQTEFTKEGLLWAYPQLCKHFEIPIDATVQAYLRGLGGKTDDDEPMSGALIPA